MPQDHMQHVATNIYLAAVLMYAYWPESSRQLFQISYSPFWIIRLFASQIFLLSVSGTNFVASLACNDGGLWWQ